MKRILAVRWMVTVRALLLVALVMPHFIERLRAQEGLDRRTWTIDGVEREGLIYTPAKAKEVPSPVVFAFHGHGGSMRNAARTFHMHKEWPEAICVYLQGLNTPGRLTDPEGKKPGWQHGAGEQGDRDLKLFDAVLETLHKDFKVDDACIFSTGHSNGGGFTYLLWAQRGDKLAAVAPSASAARSNQDKLSPKPVLHIAGRNDPLVKFAWQEAMIEQLKKNQQCETTSKKWFKDKCDVFASKVGAPVVTMIHDGDHKYPIDAPEAIVHFFKEFKSLVQTEKPN